MVSFFAGLSRSFPSSSNREPWQGQSKLWVSGFHFSAHPICGHRFVEIVKRFITGLVQRSGKVKGYQLSDGRIISREEGVALAKDGEIKGVGIAHNGDTVYLESLPDDSESNNLSSLPTIRADKFMS